MVKLEIRECTEWGYRARTVENIKESDVTIAIASNFYTGGEILTRNECQRQKKLYIPIAYVDYYDANSIVDKLNSIPGYEIIVNFAGNGVYTLGDSQDQVDIEVYTIFESVVNSSKLKKKIKYVRSGGQSGIDEAGVKAALKLGIPAFVLAPKGYLYKNKSGHTIRDKELFTKRFL